MLPTVSMQPGNAIYIEAWDILLFSTQRRLACCMFYDVADTWWFKLRKLVVCFINRSSYSMTIYRRKYSIINNITFMSKYILLVKLSTEARKLRCIEEFRSVHVGKEKGEPTDQTHMPKRTRLVQCVLKKKKSTSCKCLGGLDFSEQEEFIRKCIDSTCREKFPAPPIQMLFHTCTHTAQNQSHIQPHIHFPGRDGQQGITFIRSPHWRSSQKGRQSCPFVSLHVYMSETNQQCLLNKSQGQLVTVAKVNLI